MTERPHSVSELKPNVEGSMQAKSRMHRLRLSALFFACSVSIFAVPEIFFAYSAPTEVQTAYILGLPVAFLAFALLFRRNKQLAGYFQLFFAYFIASAVYTHNVLLSYLFQIPLGYIPSSVDGIVLFKLLSTALVVVPIVLLSKVAGNDMGSIYLRKGKLWLGLFIGIAAFLVFLATSVQASTLFYGGKDLSFGSVIAWAPSILAFVLANGLREELWFRGLFLKKYESFVGASPANFLQALVFPLAHIGARYSPFLLVFLFIVFFLGLTFGALMQKTNSLLGSVLFHAGTDIPVVLAYFSAVS